MMRGLVLLSSSLLVACGPDLGDPADAEFEPLCGQEGPVELLALAADEEVVWADRISGSDDVHVRVKVDGHVGDDDPALLRRNVVLDGCGEVVAEVASGVDSLMWWDDALIGCIEHDLVTLPSYDSPSPTLLLRQGCGRVRPMGDRWLAVDAEPDATLGRVVAIERTGGAVSVRTLVDEILADGVRMVDDELFVQTPDLAVHRVDPSTGELELELEQAADWSMSSNVVVYRLPSADPAVPSPLLVRDRRTGAEETFEPGVPTDDFTWMADGLLATWAADAPPEEWRYFRVEPLRELDVPAGTYITRQRDDGSFWLLRGVLSQSDQELLSWREGEAPQSAWSCTSCRVVVASRASDYSEWLVESLDSEERELWRYTDAGGPPRLLGNALRGGEVLDDGRVLTVRVGDDDEHGPLLLADDLSDPDGSTVTLVSNVDVASIYFTLEYDVPGELVYEATLEDGKHGLFRDRLAP